MLSPMKTAQLASFAAILTAANVEAHGYLSAPAATFTTSSDPTQFCATIDGPSTLTAPSGMSFTSDPASNTKAFTAALKASTYTSMRALVDAKAVFISGATKECGITSATGTKQALPATYVEWSHSSTEGFTASHQGPCEVWCDSTLAFQDDNCAADYTTAPAKLPYDKSKCAGASMLKFYWLALHSSTWQVYLNCAPLVATTTTSPTVTPTTTTKTPATTTKTPATTTKTPATTTKTPATTTKTPATTTKTPATTTKTPATTTKTPATTTKAPTATKATKTPKPTKTSKTPKPTKAAKTPKPTKESRSADYGFDDLN